MLCNMELQKAATGLVVRPAAADGGYQMLVYFADEVRTLEGGSDGEPLRLGPKLQLVDGASGGRPYVMSSAGRAVFEPASGCVFFVEGTAVMRLDRANAVTLAAGNKVQPGQLNGVGAAARFSGILALAADGGGAIYAAERWGIRKLSFGGVGSSAAAQQPACATVTALPNTTPRNGPQWAALAYSAAAGGLLAATEFAVVAIPLPEGGSTGGPPQLLAGGPTYTGEDALDGHGHKVRFTSISSMLAGADGSVYIADYTFLRKLDVGQRTVRTLQECIQHGRMPTSLAILPSGHLAGTGATRDADSLSVLAGGFTFSSLTPKARTAGPAVAEDLVRHLLASAPDCRGSAASDGSGCGLTALAPRRSKRQRAAGDASSSLKGSGGDNADSGSGGSSGGGGVVTVRVGDRAFIAHRSLLAHHSDYFKQLFEGGFVDSGAEEVALPDADPTTFGLLLAYMYRGVLDVPYDLIRPAAELAGWLFMPAVCHELSERLMTTCTPESVVSNLLWAEKHSMGELVAQLMAYFVRHARQVTAETPPSKLAELAATCPGMTAELMAAALGAPA